MSSRRGAMCDVAAVAVALVASLSSATMSAAAVVTHYSFEGNGNDTAAGGTTTDDLAGSGAITYEPGIVGQAVSISGGAYFSVANSADTDLLTAPWSIEVFVKAPAIDTWAAVCASSWDVGTSGYFFGLFESTSRTAMLGGGSVGNTGRPLDDDQWHHVLISNNGNVSDPAGMNLYVDGKHVQQGAGYVEDQGGNSFFVGASAAAVWPYTGLIDELVIHDEVKDGAYARSRAALLPGTLVAEYTFEDNLDDTATEGAVADTLSARNNANAVITPPADDYEPGVVGKALRLGQNTATDTQWAGAADSPDADVPPCYTLEAFIRPDSVSATDHNRILLHWEPVNAYHLSLSSGKAGLYHGQSNGASANTYGGIVQVGNWYHVAATADPTDTNGGANPNGTIRAWLNGVNVASAAYDGTVADCGNLMWLGSDTLHSPFVGLIDEVRVWHNVAKDAAYMQERTQLMMNLQPATGLRFYYPFDGDSLDAAPRSNWDAGSAPDNLAAAGAAVTYEAGAVERAVRLTGANYLVAPHSADQVPPNQFTIEAWIKADDPAKSWNRLVLSWSGEFAYHFALRGGDVDLYINQANNSSVEARGVDGYELDTGWHHVAAVAGGTTLRVYRDGLQVGSGTYDGTIFQSTTAGLGVGDSSIGNGDAMRFTGLVDELAFWDVPLDGGVLAAHYSRGPMGYDLVEPPRGTVFVVR